MADNISLLAVFPDLEPAADAIDQLRTLGISDDSHECHFRRSCYRSHAWPPQPMDKCSASCGWRRSIGIFGGCIS